VPELPEVETVRRRLDPVVTGATITSVEVGRERVVRRSSAAALIDGLVDRRILEAQRRGKYLIFPLSDRSMAMVHLRMSGQLLLARAEDVHQPHTHVVIALDSGDELRFVDPRTFGEVMVIAEGRIGEQAPGLANLGLDPLVDAFGVEQLVDILSSRRRRLKSLLLDQRLIAGLGNIYTDEVLHRARLHPLRRSDTVGRAAARDLHRSILEVLEAAVSAGGSTLSDAQYVDPHGVAGEFQQQHRVYGRTGQRCRDCGRGVVRRCLVAQRSTHYCPWCQRLPRSSGSGSLQPLT